jgi:hypothetical protein
VVNEQQRLNPLRGVLRSLVRSRTLPQQEAEPSHHVHILGESRIFFREPIADFSYIAAGIGEDGYAAIAIGECLGDKGGGFARPGARDYDPVLTQWPERCKLEETMLP